MIPFCQKQVTVKFDRFILNRNDVNFSNYYSDALVRQPTTTKEITRRKIRENYKSINQCRTLKKTLGIGTSFKTEKKNENKAVQQCSQLWDCHPRRKPVMEVYQMLGTSVISRLDLWSELAGVGRNGRFVAKYESQLTDSRVFFQDPSHLELVKYWKPYSTYECWYVITALWLHPSGEGILLGFFHGNIQVPITPIVEKGNFIISHERTWRCPGLENYERLLCSIYCFEYHSARFIIYWACTHGIFARKSSTDIISQEINKRVVCIKLSPSGAYLAASVNRGGVRIYDAYRLYLVHHLEQKGTIAKALDWHPWIPNLLATGEWDNKGQIHIWKCNLDQPHVATISNSDLDIFILKFHPHTGELVYSQYKPDPAENDLEKGESTLVVLDGYGNVIDCCDPYPGLVTHMFWGPDASELLVGGVVDTLVRFQFTNRLASSKALQYSQVKKNENACSKFNVTHTCLR